MSAPHHAAHTVTASPHTPATGTLRMAVCAALMVASSVAADGIGYQELLDRLGAAAPSGAGVVLAQIEAGVSNYAPGTTHADFAGQSFTLQSGTSSTSSHATEVGRAWYGQTFGIAHGAASIYCYEAGNFVGAGYLKTGSGSLVNPAAPPGGARVFNHSWIGSFGSAAVDNEGLRRADFAMRRDHTLMVCGVNNGAGSTAQPLMSMGFNGLAVGVASGAHSAGPTSATIDGAGRQKPEIVAPAQYTSFSTPVVSGAAALLYETALQPPLNADIWARRGVVIKAALLAGATHRATWGNNAPQSGANRGIATLPLDPLYGVDTLNINRSHLALTAGRTPVSTTLDGASYAGHFGWAQHTWPLSSPNTSVFIRFKIDTVDNTFAAVATWLRQVATSQFAGSTAPKVANLDMTLYRAEPGGALVPITGEAGVSIFASGNCASRSTIGNVEHMYIRGLDHGFYALEVKRVDAETVGADAAIAWFVDPGPLFADLNNDGAVNGADMGSLLANWGLPGPTDLNSDGTTDGADFGALLAAWIE